jgi:predicted RNase H-like HicB family nuclease
MTDGRSFGREVAIANTNMRSQAGWTQGETMRKYAIVIEQGDNNLSAYVPDLPGCITTGRTIEEIERNIREAIELHLEGLREDGEPIPEPHTAVAYVDLQEVR